MLVQRRNNALKRNDIPNAASILKKTRQTIYNWMDRCEHHTQFCPDDVDAKFALVNTAGRPEVNRLSKEQISFAYGLWIKKAWKKYLPSGPVVRVHRPPHITFVHALVVNQYPALKGSLTIEHLMHEIERFGKRYAITTALARNGERYVREELLPSFPNDVEGPDDRWQMDARYPPMWIRNGDQICTFAVIEIIDESSRYKPAIMVIPQIEVSFHRKPQSVDFRASDVCLLLALAMDATKHRPRCIYTDNGSQFKALKHYVPYLTDDPEPPIELRRTRNGRVGHAATGRLSGTSGSSMMS